MGFPPPDDPDGPDRQSGFSAKSEMSLLTKNVKQAIQIIIVKLDTTLSVDFVSFLKPTIKQIAHFTYFPSSLWLIAWNPDDPKR